MGEADFYLMLSISIALSSKDSYAAAMYGGASPPIPPAAVIIIYAALVVVAMHAARLARGLARNGWGPVGAMGFSKRLAALLAGYPAKLGDYLSSDFDFLITVPLETPSGIRYALKLSGRLDEERELRARVRDMTKRGLLAEDDVVWVSYGYPFILSLFMGLLLFMLFGAMPIAWMFHISA
ncbi:MAG: A24 family peptidase C-terminal domain-containing protein [Desulfurococcaceae archaeon]